MILKNQHLRLIIHVAPPECRPEHDGDREEVEEMSGPKITLLVHGEDAKASPALKK
jgi:hypothetical protein